MLEYKEFKGLPRKNQRLRYHMTDWELILTMVGEKASTDITKSRDAQSFDENKKAAQKGGQIAFNTRKELEQETHQSLVSKDNFLHLAKENRKKNELSRFSCCFFRCRFLSFCCGNLIGSALVI